MVKEIILTQGQMTQVDDEDFDELNQFKWCALWCPHTESFYAFRTVRIGKRQVGEFMHRIILGLSCGNKREVDHLNHKTLDNQRHNLRIVNTRKNQENRRNQSRYGVGITFRAKCKLRPYNVQVWFAGKLHSVGFFSSVEEAQIARNCFLEQKNLLSSGNATLDVNTTLNDCSV